MLDGLMGYFGGDGGGDWGGNNPRFDPGDGGGSNSTYQSNADPIASDDAGMGSFGNFMIDSPPVGNQDDFWNGNNPHYTPYGGASATPYTKSVIEGVRSARIARSFVRLSTGTK